MGRNGEESVEKKCTSNLDTFLPTDSSPLSPHKKTESTCSGLYVIHQTLTPEPVTASLSVQLRCAAFPPLPADVSGGLPVESA